MKTSPHSHPSHSSLVPFILTPHTLTPSSDYFIHLTPHTLILHTPHTSHPHTSHRRFIWNFFRLENEHLNNCGEFRVVRDISLRPLDLSSQPLEDAPPSTQRRLSNQLSEVGQQPWEPPCGRHLLDSDL